MGKPASPRSAPLPVRVWQLGKVKDDATGSQDLLFLGSLNLERLGPKPCSKGKRAQALCAVGADAGAPPGLGMRGGRQQCGSCLLLHWPPPAPAGSAHTLPRQGDSSRVELCTRRTSTRECLEQKLAYKPPKQFLQHLRITVDWKILTRSPPTHLEAGGQSLQCDNHRDLAGVEGNRGFQQES